MSKTSLGVLVALAIALAAAIPAVALGGASAAGTHTVILKNVRFHPATLSIKRGEKVRWLWQDSTVHNVTFHGFHSHTQQRGSYTVTFSRRGAFSYECTIHVALGMKGKVIVH
jgi:plastocyanin